MTKPQRLSALLPLIRLVSDATPSLPPPERADLYEGLALITEGLDKELYRRASLVNRDLAYSVALRQPDQAAGSGRRHTLGPAES